MSAELHLVHTATQALEGELLPAAGAPASLLSREDAQELTVSIRRNLRGALEGLATAREQRAWAALGYPTWHDYCEQEFGSLAELALPVQERVALVVSMSTAQPPMPTRTIAERLGVSASTVSTDRRTARAAGVELPDKVTGRDGVERPSTSTRRLQPAPEPEPEPAHFTDRLVALVSQLGPVSAARLEDETGRRHGAVSAALHRLSVPGGRLVYTRPAKRGQTGTYTVARTE